MDIPLVIAGNKPSAELEEAVRQHDHIELKDKLTSGQIYNLIKEAHINVLPTFQTTGIKLKLIAALFSGRHCVVNTPMVKGTGLEELCSIRDTEKDMKEEITRLFNVPFSGEEIEKRKNVLSDSGFANATNVKKMMALLF